MISCVRREDVNQFVYKHTCDARCDDARTSTIGNRLIVGWDGDGSAAFLLSGVYFTLVG